MIDDDIVAALLAALLPALPDDLFLILDAAAATGQGEACPIDRNEARDKEGPAAGCSRGSLCGRS